MFQARRCVFSKFYAASLFCKKLTMAQKRPFNEGKRHFKKSKKQKTSTVADGSNEEVLLTDVRRLLNDVKISPDESKDRLLPEQWSEIDLDITELSSTGDGLAEKDGQVYVVPFAAPGDTVSAKVVKHFSEEKYTLTDFLSVKTAGQHRTETPRCRYFTQCGGCQFQHLSYAYQLAHKRRIVEKAYENFSKLPASDIPAVRETVGSPLQYTYRTKLTPHFEPPAGARGDRKKGQKVRWDGVPPIGFMKKGTRKTLDIEECPIGTEAVQAGLKTERMRVERELEKYQRGATLLLRENTERIKKSDEVPAAESDVVIEDRGEWLQKKTCITDSKATSTEYIDDFRFDNPAGAFFQNNNSILPLVTQYVRDNILGNAVEDTQTTDGAAEQKKTTNGNAANSTTPRIKNMIDAYCGSGFFTVTLSGMFSNSIGIDISAQSIASASINAKLNNLPEASTHFLAADANQLFSAVDTEKFPPSETAVVIDPPRKGCDEGFIRQLMAYGPERVCYVSCNVHSQARDVGWLVGGLQDEEGLPIDGMYEIESLRGFDFFPQTGHVEGVAILRRKKRDGDLVSGATNGIEGASVPETLQNEETMA